MIEEATSEAGVRPECGRDLLKNGLSSNYQICRKFEGVFCHGFYSVRNEYRV